MFTLILSLFLSFIGPATSDATTTDPGISTCQCDDGGTPYDKERGKAGKNKVAQSIGQE
ncbi:MAG: hypothetical protein AB8H12_22000 [Lewinella sp.]